MSEAVNTGVGTAPAAGERKAAGGQTQEAKAEKEKGAAAQGETEAERVARYRALVGEGGEFADLYRQDTQKAVKGRLAEAKRTLDAQRPVLDLLMTRYGAQDMDQLRAAIDKDAGWWRSYADDRGLTEEQAREQIAMQAELEARRRQSAQMEGERRMHAQMQAWAQQSQEVQAVYPEFDLSAQLQDQTFKDLLLAGVQMKTAYEVANMEAIKLAVAQAAAKDAEGRVTASIQANGARPVEGGASGQVGAAVKLDPSKMTGAELRDLAARAAKGERISFG